MKLDMDKIQFESRIEITAIAGALEKYLQNQKKPDDGQTIQELIDLLDKMYMSW